HPLSSNTFGDMFFITLIVIVVACLVIKVGTTILWIVWTIKVTASIVTNSHSLNAPIRLSHVKLVDSTRAQVPSFVVVGKYSGRLHRMGNSVGSFGGIKSTLPCGSWR